MSVNRGKDFEAVVRECMQKVPETYVLRLYDPQGGYSSVANPCDFVVYRRGILYMIECKAVHGNLLSINSNDPKKKYGQISNTQWEGLLEARKKGVVAGVLVWWIDHDVTKFIPIEEVALQKDYCEAKSIRYDLDIPYSNIITGTKKRVFFDYDFEAFFNKHEEGEKLF